jgi:uncharacterized membrane protein YphA (DoxX/SURF4 family)
MSQVLSKQQENRSNTTPKYQKGKNVTLWILQVIIALIFLFAGGMKLILPVEALLAEMPIKMPDLFVRFIGVCEVLGALGLVLPALTRVRRELTPLAAWALALEMVCATVYTLLGGGGATALMPLVLGLLCAAIAYGRRAFFAQA